MLDVRILKRLGAFCLDVDFKAEAEVTGILGASGCGKSMTLRCIAGIERPDWGHIELDGEILFDSERCIDLPPQKRLVGYLFQNYALFPNMSVKKNILCGLYGEKDTGKREQALAEVTALLKLEGLAKHRPVQLSGGQAQRVALARILVNNPRMLMLDEPFSALDSHLRTQLQIQLNHILERRGGTVLMVTHSRDEAYHMCGQIALMSEGRLLSKKPTREMFADPGTVAGAEITGCKNVFVAKKCGEYEVEVPELGIRLTTGQPVGDNLRAIGIRAHYYAPEIVKNRFPIYKIDEMEEPFEWIIRFRYVGQQTRSEDIWWRMPKSLKPQTMPEEIGVMPDNILLLY